MKKNKKSKIKDYLLALKYIIIPYRKYHFIRSGHKKINSDSYIICKILVNNEKKIHNMARYYKAPIDLYRAVKSIITISNDIYFTKNQKGFNTFFQKKQFDIIITNRSGKVLELFKAFKLNKISSHFPTGYYVYYFPMGSIIYYDIHKNDLIDFRKDILSSVNLKN